MSALRFGIAIPQIFTEEPVRVATIREFVTRAEALGFDSLWVQEQMLGAAPTLDPIGLLTHAAAFTTRVRLGTAVLLTVLHSPVHLAKSLATLDRLSDGRLIVGVGLGAGQPRYPAFGVPVESRIARFTEGIRLMRALWTEPRVTFKGRVFSLENAAMEPKPVQQPHPPLWFGAHHPDAIRRAVELGDGFIGAGSSSPDEFRHELDVLRGTLSAAGRDETTFPVSKRVYVAVDEDRDRAGRRLRDWFAAYYRNADLAERVSIWGSPQQCVDGLAALAGTGVSLLLLNPVFDHVHQMERLAAEVMPRV